MKALITLAIVTAAVGARHYLGAGCCGTTCPESDLAPSGGYVEARTASLFAGACHYNSELVTTGHEVVLAWSFESGRIAGVSLAGVDVVAAVASPENLKLGASRKSVIYVDARATEQQRATAVEYVQATCADVLGSTIAVETKDLDVAIEGDHYQVHVAGALELEGSGLVDRACCSMPFNVWYEPSVELSERVVGNSVRFDWHEARLAPNFERTDQNDAFVGSFGSSVQ